MLRMNLQLFGGRGGSSGVNRGTERTMSYTSLSSAPEGTRVIDENGTVWQRVSEGNNPFGATWRSDDGQYTVSSVLSNQNVRPEFDGKVGMSTLKALPLGATVVDGQGKTWTKRNDEELPWKGQDGSFASSYYLANAKEVGGVSMTKTSTSKKASSSINSSTLVQSSETKLKSLYKNASSTDKKKIAAEMNARGFSLVDGKWKRKARYS